MQQAIGEVRAAAASVRDDQSPIGTMLAELRGLADTLRREVANAKLGETTGSVREATAAVGQLGADVRGELAQLRATLAAVERLAALLERDPGALLHGHTAPRSPLQENPR